MAEDDGNLDLPGELLHERHPDACGCQVAVDGNAVGRKADVETEEIDAFVMKGLGKGKEVVPFAAARVQVKKRKAV